MISTPIAYIIFNRPRHTRETFVAIRAQRPKKLFIIADGPRSGHPADADRCREVREIVEVIDWPCDVSRNYANENQGCKHRVISGLDWVFSQTENAIILEDDCLPHPDFYGYCEELLELYKDNDRVMVITGCNFQNKNWRGDAAYYFSKYNHVWGWATWRRAWKQNDLALAFWPLWKESASWARHMPDKVERRYWENIFDQMYRNEIDTWDYSWTASVWYHGGLTATPNVNLVTNIGFGQDGTHTVASEDQEGLPVYPLGPLTHPEKIEQDRKADRYVFDHHFGGLQQRLHRRLLGLPRRIVGKIIRTLRRQAGLPPR
jgi:hypothetical protein